MAFCNTTGVSIALNSWPFVDQGVIYFIWTRKDQNENDSLTDKNEGTEHTCVQTLYTLTSVCIFSILFSIHFLRCWQGEFVQQSRACLVGDNFLITLMLDSGVIL